MRKDAETHADEDKLKKELIDARNEADSKVYQLEKLLRENGEKIKDADKAPIQSAIEKVKQASGAEDVAALRRAISDLDQAAHAMSQHLYQQPGPAAGGGETGPSGAPSGDGKSGKDDVIDAEFEVKK
jgi:molecular chaperone DnaK